MKRLTSSEFIEKAIMVHGNRYDYSETSYGQNNRTKITIICPVHGRFLQSPNNHLDCKTGCPICSNNVKLTTKTFITKAHKIHGNRYDYSKTVYGNNNSDKVIIICKIHGVFSQTPANHIGLHQGCPTCANNVRLSTKEFIIKAKKTHGNKYIYSKVEYGKNNMKKVTIICKKHGEFTQRPANHLFGAGCPKCNRSRGERKIEKFLSIKKIHYESEKSFPDCINPHCKDKRGKLKFDFYLPHQNMLIEYDGKQHFKVNACIKGRHTVNSVELKETKYRDMLKTEYALRNGFKLLRIKYTQFNLIDALLSEAIK